MTPLAVTTQPTAPAIQTRQQLEAVVENIVQLQIEQAELECAREREIAAVREKYRPSLVELERFLLLETTWAETWARANPGELGEHRSLECAHATISFRVTPPRVERASRKWTWTAIAVKLAESTWGRRYLRIPSPEVNKEALLVDHAQLSDAELRLAGIKIVGRERFLVTPHGSEEVVAAPEPEWQEAA